MQKLKVQNPNFTKPHESKTKWHALLASWLGETFDAMDALMYFIILYPALSELLHTNNATTIGWYGALIMSIFTFGWGLGSLLFGFLSDRLGRVKIMTATIIIYSIASALCAISSHWWDLAIYRFFVGLGIGGECSIGSTILSEFWKQESKAKQLWVISIMQTSFPIGAILTGMLNYGSGQFGWRYLFLVGLIPATVALYIRMTMKEPSTFQELEETRNKIRNFGINLLSNDEKTLLENPLKTIFDKSYRRSTIVICTIVTSATVAYWAGVTWMPAWINQLTASEAIGERSASSIYISLGSLAAILLLPFILSRLGYVKSFKISFLSSLLIAFSMFSLVHSYMPLVINACSFAIGFMACMPWVIVCSYLPQIYPTHLLGTGAGITWAIGRFITAIVGLCVGPIIAFFQGSYGMAAATVTLVYGIGFLAAFKLHEPNKYRLGNEHGTV